MSNARNLARLLPNTSGQLPDANLAAIAAGKVSGKLADANMASGSVIQVVSVANTGTGSGTTNNWIDVVTGVTIVPHASSSKILLVGHLTGTSGTGNEFFGRIQVSVGGGAYADVGSNSFASMFGNSAGYSRDGYDWQIVTIPLNFVYTVSSTASLTFKAQIAGQDPGGSTFYYNRTRSTSGGDSGSAISVLTALEIAG